MALPLDVDSTQVDFSSIFVNELSWELSLLVKRTRMEWETTPTSDLRKTAKILNFQLQQMKSPK